jgi:hypothetical protein
MPRKRKPRFSEYKIPTIDPEDPNKVPDHDLVRHALVDFDELANLPSESREQLVEDLVKSICFARGGVKAGKQGVSDKALGKQIFLSDVGGALELYPRHDGGRRMRAMAPILTHQRAFSSGWPASLPTSSA